MSNEERSRKAGLNEEKSRTANSNSYRNSLLFDFTIDKATLTIFITREFQADLSRVWDAFTKAEFLDQWWAPKPLVSKTRVMNFEVGGRRFYSMIWPEGQEYWGVKKYTLIHPKTRIKWVAFFTDKDESINAELPTSEWELHFIEDSDRKTIVKIFVKSKTLADLELFLEMGFKEGFTMTINELEHVLKTLHL